MLPTHISQVGRSRSHGSATGWTDDVEAVQAIPTYTDDIRELIVSGIPIYNTSDFETVENLLLEKGAADE